MGERSLPFARPTPDPRVPRRRPPVVAAAVLALALVAGCSASGRTHHVPTPAQLASSAAERAVAIRLAQLRRAQVRQRQEAAAAMHRRREIALFAREARAQRGPCYGAAALRTPAPLCAGAASEPLRPPLWRAPLDKSDAYQSVSGQPTCFSYRPWFPEVICNRGDPTGSFRVALVGNSHAGQWLPALELVARHLHWRISTFLASNCALAETTQDFGPMNVTAACRDWVTTTTARVAAGHFDLVLLTDKMSIPALGHTLAHSQRAYELGFARVLQSWHRRHLTVVALRDTPAPWPVDVPRCLATRHRHYSACAGRRSAWLRPDPVLQAVRAQRDPRITGADLSAEFCGATSCPAVIGGVIVYFDGSHITATYSRTLAPALQTVLLRAKREPAGSPTRR